MIHYYLIGHIEKKAEMPGLFHRFFMEGINQHLFLFHLSKNYLYGAFRLDQ